MCSKTKYLLGVSLLVAAGSAAAQSSVTVYGVADTFIQFLGNGAKHSWSERSGGNTGSSFGLRGSEDLGNGLKAVFTLENGYNINNGGFFVDSTALFYRQAWVGLNHADYGSLTFGRQYQPTFWAIYPSDPFRGDEVLSPLAAAAVATDMKTIATQAAQGRSSNSMVYQSPVVGGLKLYAMYGFAATTTTPIPQTTGNILDLALTYSGYGLYAGLAYQNQHAGAESVPGLPVALNLLATERFTAALAYRIGIVNLQANYTYNRSKDAPAGSLAARLGAAHSYGIAEVGATIQATSVDTIEIAGIERDVRGAHDNTPGVQIGVDHLLSKRTTIYARAGYMKNNGSAMMSWPGVTASGPQATQTMVALGLSHRF
ncbi:Outer membrane porin protein 32 [Paraburkholderia caffeinitolerans]|uniref:Outer membrane porin protein 32 n=1 Tax=Paraburkholderia caffeinitolerans TaxID=1723730 RepID=A0A6J5FHT6_9BURK|nr:MULTISPECIES: porin [Paraburkholderia]CAB3778413.1 Outer membrane porin protein 32 [Paraburkholderia caffeinitolerans]